MPRLNYGLKMLGMILISVSYIWHRTHVGCVFVSQRRLTASLPSPDYVIHDPPGNFTESEMVENTTVNALCASIYESIVEACVFGVGDHIYVGEWDMTKIETACGGTTSPQDPGPSMNTVEVSDPQLQCR